MQRRQHRRAASNPNRAIALALACIAFLGGGCAGVPLGPGTTEVPEGAEFRIGIVEYHPGSMSFEAPPAGYRLRGDDADTTLYLRVANDLRSPTLEPLVGERVRVAGLIGELVYGEIGSRKAAVMDVAEVWTPPLPDEDD